MLILSYTSYTTTHKRILMTDVVGNEYKNATAFVMTFVVNNHLDPADNLKAMAWEAEFIKFMKGYKNKNMILSFSSEVRLHVYVK